MKVLVCMATAVETTARIKFTADGSAFDPEGVQFFLNPYDEWYALVRALELRDEKGGEVIVLHAGGSQSEQALRKALAIGADEVIRIDRDPVSAGEAAFLLAQQIKGMEYDIIFTGKETVDYNGKLVSAMLAGHLGIPYVSTVSKLTMDGESVVMDREIEGGTEKVRVALPLVLSANQGLAEQRIPNMKGIMMAKRKPIDVVAAQPFEAGVEFGDFSLPVKEKEITYIDPDNMEELVHLLHTEAKVI